MRGLASFVAMLTLSILAFRCSAGTLKEPKYSSEKPLYARLALDQKATKVLTLAFDESGGTGKGYDTAYADLNLNGDLTDDKAIKGTLRRYGGSNVTCSLGPIAVDVPYNEKAQGVEKPWELTINYHQLTRSRLFGLIKGETYRSLLLLRRMKLKDERGEWVYSLQTLVKQDKSLAEASPIAFGGEPMLQLDTKPDPQKKGNRGIAADVRLGSTIFRCLRGGQAVPAEVRVTSQDGKTVHSDEVLSDKLSFG
jgi:hypothetical protein